MASKKIFLFFIIYFAIQDVIPADATQAQTEYFIKWIDSYNSLTGNFRQVQLNQDNPVKLESSGTFALLKPVYFKWNIIAPDNQVLISDAKFIWLYDRDLNTVMRNPIEDQMSFVQLLMGDSKALKQTFSITQINFGREYFLIPKKSNSVFYR